MKKIFLVLILILSSLVLVSCKKDKEEVQIIEVRTNKENDKNTTEKSLLEKHREEFYKENSDGSPTEKDLQRLGDFKEYTIIAEKGKLNSDTLDLAGKKEDTIKLNFITDNSCPSIKIPKYNIELKPDEPKTFIATEPDILEFYCTSNENMKIFMLIEE